MHRHVYNRDSGNGKKGKACYNTFTLLSIEQSVSSDDEIHFQMEWNEWILRHWFEVHKIGRAKGSKWQKNWHTEKVCAIRHVSVSVDCELFRCILNDKHTQNHSLIPINPLNFTRITYLPCIVQPLDSSEEYLFVHNGTRHTWTVHEIYKFLSEKLQNWDKTNRFHYLIDKSQRIACVQTVSMFNTKWCERTNLAGFFENFQRNSHCVRVRFHTSRLWRITIWRQFDGGRFCLMY